MSTMPLNLIHVGQTIWEEEILWYHDLIRVTSNSSLPAQPVNLAKRDSYFSRKYAFRSLLKSVKHIDFAYEEWIFSPFMARIKSTTHLKEMIRLIEE